MLNEEQLTAGYEEIKAILGKYCKTPTEEICLLAFTGWVNTSAHTVLMLHDKFGMEVENK